MSARPSAHAPRLPRVTGTGHLHGAGRSIAWRALAAADRRRIKGTWILPLTVMGPAGVTLLGVVLFMLRGEWILSGYDPAVHSGLGIVAGQLGFVHVFALCLGATLLASMVADVEHRADAWKSTFALPVRRWKAYLTKFVWTAGLLGISSFLMGLGYAAIVIWQGIGPVPWDGVLKLVSLPWIGTLPLVAFQLLVSVALKNQAVPLALGIITPMFGMGMRDLPLWLPWRLPSVALEGAAVSGQLADAATRVPASVIAAAALCGAVLLLGAGAVMIERKDIA